MLAAIAGSDWLWVVALAFLAGVVIVLVLASTRR
jgi:hypothetical protein